MLDGIEDRQHLTSEEFRASIAEQCGEYVAQARRHMKAITEYGAALAAGAQRIVAFDYLSSVAAILKAIGRSDSATTVPRKSSRHAHSMAERRYVEDLEQSLLQHAGDPDAAIGSEIKGCDLALIGAETVSRRGRLLQHDWKLHGCACLSILARSALHPDYLLVKIDTRTLFGRHRPIPSLGAAHLGRLTEGWPSSLTAGARIRGPELATHFLQPLHALDSSRRKASSHPPRSRLTRRVSSALRRQLTGCSTTDTAAANWPLPWFSCGPSPRHTATVGNR